MTSVAQPQSGTESRKPETSPKSARRVGFGVGPKLSRGMAVGYLSLMVLIPIAAVVTRSFDDGVDAFWSAITASQGLAALKLTFVSSLIVVAINAVMGTILAWVLVRDQFPGKRLINSLIDLPFALPTIVTGLVLLALYGDTGLLGIQGVSYTQVGVVMALLFVTLPFVVRAVQPVLIELDRDMEEAAASLGARPLTIFRRIVLPNLAPAIAGGVALAFARSIGEFGSLILISGNIPFQTEVSSVYIFGQIESGNTTSAAAVSVLLLAISLVVLLSINAIGKWAGRHDNA